VINDVDDVVLISTQHRDANPSLLCDIADFRNAKKLH